MRRQAVVLPYTSGRPHARMLADRVTRADIIPHIELTDDLANELATSPDENVRAALAARPDLPATVVDLLAADPGTVRPADLSGLALSVLPQGPCELHEPAGGGTGLTAGRRRPRRARSGILRADSATGDHVHGPDESRALTSRQPHPLIGRRGCWRRPTSGMTRRSGGHVGRLVFGHRALTYCRSYRDPLARFEVKTSR